MMESQRLLKTNKLTSPRLHNYDYYPLPPCLDTASDNHAQKEKTVSDLFLHSGHLTFDLAFFRFHWNKKKRYIKPSIVYTV